MKKVYTVLVIGIIVILLMIIRTHFLNISNASKGYVIFDNNYIDIPDSLFLQIKAGLNYSFLFNDTPSCPLDEGLQLVFLDNNGNEVQRLLIGQDGCGTFFDPQTKLYLEEKKTTQRIIKDFLNQQ